MPTYQLLTDRTLAQSSAITPTTLIHIVYTGDPSQNPAGSSYKAQLGQLVNLFSGGTFTGGTVPGVTTFTNGLSANTISATTIGSSGDCVDDLYVSNIHSCSPLRINPLNEGNVYFGSTSGITIDLTNTRLGIGINGPQYFLHAFSGGSQFFYNPTSSGGVAVVSGTTNLPRYAVNVPAYLTKSASSASFGIRAWNDSTTLGYGKVGDAHVYSSVESNGINIISAPGSGTEDYIRFYAGKIATGTSDMYIQGTGATQGYVGIGTETPSANLDVSGKTKTTNFQMTSGATNGYVLTSDANGNARWQASTFTGGTVSGTTTFTNGLSANTISATTIGSSGDCVDDLYVTNIHSCSPLNINPLNEGNIYVGSNSGFTYDIVNESILLKGNVNAQSDTLSLSSIITSSNNSSFKGSIKYFSHTGTTASLLYNPNTSGDSQVTVGTNLNSNKNMSLSYYGDNYIRTATTPVNGSNFYQNKGVLSIGTNSNGMVINISPTGNTGNLWFEQNGNSIMYLKGGPLPQDGKLGLMLNPDGTEAPTANLQVGGTGTTGTAVINGTLRANTISATTFTGGTYITSGSKGSVTISGGTSLAFINISGSNTNGGTGYTDFIRVTNTASGATNPNKSFRLNNVGDVEIISSTYGTNIFTLSDTGNMTVPGRVKSNINYSQTGGGASVTLAAIGTPQTILSVSITTYGNPVMVCAYGDAENTGAGYWSKLQLWRDSTQIGAIVHTEGSAGSENSPFAFTYIDAPAAGTYTYYLKANEISGGSIKFGESTAPILNVREL